MNPHAAASAEAIEALDRLRRWGQRLRTHHDWLVVMGLVPDEVPEPVPLWLLEFESVWPVEPWLVEPELELV